jgi:hypothetical protein
MNFLSNHVIALIQLLINVSKKEIFNNLIVIIEIVEKKNR